MTLTEKFNRVMKLPMMFGNLHITHNDADGLACFVIDDFLNYQASWLISEAGLVMDYFFDWCIKEGGIPDVVLMTDLSFNETSEEKEMYEELRKKIRFKVIDHHATALWMNNYEECTVKTCNGSAAKMYLKEYEKAILKGVDKNVYYNLTQYIDIVSTYDTWKWKEIQDEVGHYENEMILSTRYDSNFYVENTIEKIRSLDFSYEYTKTDLSLIKRYKKEKEGKISYAAENVKDVHLSGYHILLYIGGVNASSFSEYYFKKNPDKKENILGVLYLDSGELSLRTTSDNIDVGEFAKKFGGGGHPQAAGCHLGSELITQLIQEFYVV